MFGVLKPTLCGVSEKCKESYRLTYCNLCAALSASGAGVFNRLFLINDVVTIDWLLRADKNISSHAFKCYNCTKGGVIGRKKSVSEHQKFLAAVSSYVCGVKIQDNADDNPKVINKLTAVAYKQIMKKAEAILTNLNLLEKYREYQKTDRENELNKITSLEQASHPTELCYELCTLEDSKYLTNLPKNILSLLGRYLGRCVYFLDAIADMEKDKKLNQYNILNLKVTESEGQYSKEKIVGLCLDSLKPMRHELAAMLDSLSQDFNVDLVKSRWNSLFNNIEKQLLKLIKPLNSAYLLKNISSFSPITSCSSHSSWPSAYVCCPMCEGCCPCGDCCGSCCSCKCCCG